ncbi:magnesium-transporting ATPase MgtA [Enterobacter asburiae]|uniref:Magnesium-transporting ATPase MgtA n=1 Tax=Enterobacter asburiae TaxID=61645 RepID=A0A376FGP3_ENTAS|nr:magnesium-transporting ATPase MgtA [Enterobacter asburiae]
MFKNITRQLQALLSRHLPHRLVQRDPLPNAKKHGGHRDPRVPDRTLPERGGDG